MPQHKGFQNALGPPEIQKEIPGTQGIFSTGGHHKCSAADVEHQTLQRWPHAHPETQRIRTMS